MARIASNKAADFLRDSAGKKQMTLARFSHLYRSTRQSTVAKSLIGLFPRKHAQVSNFPRPVPEFPGKGHDLVLCNILGGTIQKNENMAKVDDSVPEPVQPDCSARIIIHDPRGIPVCRTH